MGDPASDDSVREIMQGFAARTGLAPESAAPRRYLWTDAFAVCNFLGLHQRLHQRREEGHEEALRLALRLVDQVHGVLGRHRPDDTRSGWISGLGDAEGALHPTAGGLRIGKELPERPAGARYDPALEWERDGQYFHYLTRWMHALDRVTQVTGDARYLAWSCELAKRAYAGFAVEEERGAPIGLYWKMSIDLRRPLIPSMGQHDPLDGFLVYSRLQAELREQKACDLRPEIAALREICRGRSWLTDDALGIGGLLTDAHALARMIAQGALDESELLDALLVACRSGLDSLMRARALEHPATSRLPFRELGLAIGLLALPPLRRCVERTPAAFGDPDGTIAALDSLDAYRSLASQIAGFWLTPEHRRSPTWIGHREINEVMLATSLAPDGYLGLGSGPTASGSDEP